jgi:aspartate aminotransferase
VTVSRQLRELGDALGGFADYSASLPDERPADFLFGNPQELTPRSYVDALRTAAEPTDAEHYAYTMSLPAAAASIAEGLRARFGIPFDREDVAMTNGNFAGLSVTLRTIADPGDEIVYVSPPWFFYEALILAGGMRPVRVPATPETYDLDIDAIAAALGPSTRALIVNSPHNPSGRIYPAGALEKLAAALRDASTRHGRPIYLLSDEAYHRIVFDGRDCPTPLAHYAHSFMLYTYAKTLLSPGSRLGFITMPPSMPDREELRTALALSQIATGWAFPSSVLQHAVPTLETLDPGVATLQGRRDRLCGALRAQGYDLLVPEGTFYVLVRSPIEDDRSFCDLLASKGVWVLPGSMFESPGRFRISLTGNDDMVGFAIPRFAEALAEVRG